jgi:hypothetical protein
LEFLAWAHRVPWLGGRQRRACTGAGARTLGMFRQGTVEGFGAASDDEDGVRPGATEHGLGVTSLGVAERGMGPARRNNGGIF